MSRSDRVRLHSRSLHKVDARCLIQDFCRNGLLPELFFERQFGTELRRKSLGLKRIAIKWQQQIPTANVAHRTPQQLHCGQAVSRVPIARA